jgi:tetratricopeptide (TPR) repeat protein
MPLDIQQTSADKRLSPRHFHVFLSSPGDVGEERRIVEDVIQTRLAKDAFLRGRVTFDVISWDDPNAPTPMPANLSPQDAVIRFGRRPAECEIVIVVLWSRLGTHLDTAKFTKSNGEPYLSGTEWEYEDAANADPPPDVLLYRRTEKPRIDIDDPELAAKKKQYELVNTFLARFHNADGSFAGSVTDYAAPDALEQRLVSDLTNLLSRRIGVADAAMAERLATLERIADEAIAAKEALERQVRELSEQQTLKDDTIRSLNAAVEALTAQARERQEVSGIETALQQLAANNVSGAVAIFQDVLDRKEADGKRKEAESKKALQEAAAAARHLGALASLQDTQGALAAYRRAANLEPEDVWTWIAIADLEVQGGTLDRAKEAAERARAVAQSTDSERDLSVSQEKIGDVLTCRRRWRATGPPSPSASAWPAPTRAMPAGSGILLFHIGAWPGMGISRTSTGDRWSAFCRPSKRKGDWLLLTKSGFRSL